MHVVISLLRTIRCSGIRPSTGDGWFACGLFRGESYGDWKGFWKRPCKYRVACFVHVGFVLSSSCRAVAFVSCVLSIGGGCLRYFERLPYRASSREIIGNFGQHLILDIMNWSMPLSLHGLAERRCKCLIHKPVIRDYQFDTRQDSRSVNIH